MAGALYPPLVVLTIVVTGNHFLLDAIAGMLVLAAGFLLVARDFAAGASNREPAPLERPELSRNLEAFATIDAASRGGAAR